MRILQICAAYKPAFIYGGPTMSVSRLSEQLVEAGVTVQVFATTANGKSELPVAPGKTVNVDGVSVTYFKRLTKDHSHFSPSLFRRLWIDAKNYDVIHIHAWWNLVSICSALIGTERGVPVLLSPRGTISSYTFNNRNISAKWLIHQLIGKWLLRKIKFHVTSKKEGDSIIEIIKPKAVTEIPNFVAIPNEMFNSAPRSGHKFRLLFLSRIEEKKGLDLLIKALPLLQAPYLLTIAGAGNPAYIERLKQLAKSAGAEHNISWIGFQGETKFNLLAEHDLLVLPSHDENFGNVVIESLSVGTAVLISKFVGLADFVSENELGWECDPEERSVADKIDWIYKNKPRLDIIRKKAPELIRKEFNEERLVNRYIDMYRSMIAGS